MRAAGGNLARPEVEAAFLAALEAAGGNISHAQRTVGLARGAVNYRRRTNAEFRAKLLALLPGGKTVRSYRRWDEATKTAFLEALAKTGSAARAALLTGVNDDSAHGLRRRDSEFAHHWALATTEAGLRVQDRLFEGALGGFTTRTVASDGTTTTTYRERPDIMLKLLARRDATAKSPYRMVELTPQAFEDAQVKIERHIRLATEARVAGLRKAGELTPEPLALPDATP